MGIQEIISKANEEMRNMLESVCSYNLKFVRNKKQKKLLEEIIYAMSVIDRKFFVEDEEFAYLDTALAIGQGQTISQPSTVARMLMLAELEEGDSVLEVGSGSGWNSSLISFLVYPEKVVSIDIIPKLVEKAKNNVSRLKQNLDYNIKKEISPEFLIKNIFNYSGEYNKIIVTAGISDEQEDKIWEIAERLLKDNGILICPRISGKMIIFKKNEKLEREETKEEYVFVPLLLASEM